MAKLFDGMYIMIRPVDGGFKLIFNSISTDRPMESIIGEIETARAKLEFACGPIWEGSPKIEYAIERDFAERSVRVYFPAWENREELAKMVKRLYADLGIDASGN